MGVFMVKDDFLTLAIIGVGAYLLLRPKEIYGATGTSDPGTNTPQGFKMTPPPSQTSGGSANTPSESKIVTFKTVTEGVNALNEAWKSGAKIETAGGVLWTNPKNVNDKIIKLSTGDVKRVSVRTVR